MDKTKLVATHIGNLRKVLDAAIKELGEPSPTDPLNVKGFVGFLRAMDVAVIDQEAHLGG